MLVKNELDGEYEGSDEDSIFVPLADLFSLLAITVIYVALTFGKTIPESSQPVAAAVVQGSGPGKPIDPRAAYVILSGSREFIIFSVVKNGETFERAVRMVGEETLIPAQWLRDTLLKSSGISTIYVYLGPDEKSYIVKALMTDTERFLRANFVNVRLAL